MHYREIKRRRKKKGGQGEEKNPSAASSCHDVHTDSITYPTTPDVWPACLLLVPAYFSTPHKGPRPETDATDPPCCPFLLPDGRLIKPKAGRLSERKELGDTGFVVVAFRIFRYQSLLFLICCSRVSPLHGSMDWMPSSIPLRSGLLFLAMWTGYLPVFYESSALRLFLCLWSPADTCICSSASTQP